MVMGDYNYLDPSIYTQSPCYFLSKQQQFVKCRKGVKNSKSKKLKAQEKETNTTSVHQHHLIYLSITFPPSLILYPYTTSYTAFCFFTLPPLSFRISSTPVTFLSIFLYHLTHSVFMYCSYSSIFIHSLSMTKSSQSTFSKSLKFISCLHSLSALSRLTLSLLVLPPTLIQYPISTAFHLLCHSCPIQLSLPNNRAEACSYPHLFF